MKSEAEAAAAATVAIEEAEVAAAWEDPSEEADSSHIKHEMIL
jgi:hypothetical protein